MLISHSGLLSLLPDFWKLLHWHSGTKFMKCKHILLPAALSLRSESHWRHSSSTTISVLHRITGVHGYVPYKSTFYLLTQQDGKKRVISHEAVTQKVTVGLSWHWAMPHRLHGISTYEGSYTLSFYFTAPKSSDMTYSVKHDNFFGAVDQSSPHAIHDATSDL